MKKQDFVKWNAGGVWGMTYLVPDFLVPKRYIKDVQRRYEQTIGGDGTYFYVQSVYEYKHYPEDLAPYQSACKSVLEGAGWDFNRNARPGMSEDGGEFSMADWDRYWEMGETVGYRRLYPVPITYFDPDVNELGEISL